MSSLLLEKSPLGLLLTEGRSLYVPITGCTQLPTWIASFGQG
jgi:hypothetical protein